MLWEEGRGTGIHEQSTGVPAAKSLIGVPVVVFPDQLTLRIIFNFFDRRTTRRGLSFGSSRAEGALIQGYGQAPWILNDRYNNYN